MNRAILTVAAGSSLLLVDSAVKGTALLVLAAIGAMILMVQIACALHWFNPLVWFAAWRLGVERERACDDLVLAGGVRPSAYARHLLEVVTGISPERSTQSCGLAMARKSSLEGRLVAVLSENRNRRGVSVALAAIALAIAAGIAVPIAMLRAAGGAWTGKLVTGATSGAVAAGEPQPKDKKARPFFKVWQDNARRNGNIPGGLVGRLGDNVKELIRLNTGDGAGDAFAKRMAPLLPRFDAARDWTPAEAVALLDDIAAISTIPLDTTMDEVADRTFRTGAPLPPELADAPWGQAQPSGLRLAWLLEPRASEHRLGTALKSRILFHNSGQNAVVFRTRTWHAVRRPSGARCEGRGYQH